jgi:(R,R)-butanediol dehydrogenase/meso-butanediol dehydrogenase/diacetyl reductase
MKALVFRNRQALVEEREKPRISAENNVLVKIKYSGICGTDIGALFGKFYCNEGVILGHEAVGVVAEVHPNVTAFRVGDPVVVGPIPYCDKCRYCRRGRHTLCVEKEKMEIGFRLDGTHAEYFVSNDTFLYSLPLEMPLIDGIFAEPLACLLNNLKYSFVEPGMSAFVYGAGPIGLIYYQLFANMGCRAVIGEIAQHRIELARRLGLNIVNLKTTKPEQIMKKFNHGHRFDVVADVTGVAFEDALKLIDRGGEILLFGLNMNYNPVFNPADLTINALRILTSIDCDKTFLPAIQMIADKKIDVSGIVTDVLPLSDYQSALRKLGFDPTTGAKVPVTAGKVAFAF